MVDFFSTVGKSKLEDDDDDLDEEQQPPSLVSLSNAPNFVKSTTRTLLTEEADIKQSRQKKAKVTFAKPKPKVVTTKPAEAAPSAPAPQHSTDAAVNFMRKDA